MLLVLSFISMFAMLNDPGSTFAVTFSMVPFTAPIAMPVRWAAGRLPLSEVALSLAILFASIIIVTWIAARIYRVGILADRQAAEHQGASEMGRAASGQTTG